MNALAVAFGAALGAITRHGIAKLGIGWRATWTANMIGSLLLGLTIGYGPTRTTALVVGTGFCGALTTMSSLMLESTERPAPQRWALLVAHTGVGLVLAALGAAIGGHIGAG